MWPRQKLDKQNDQFEINNLYPKIHNNQNITPKEQCISDDNMIILFISLVLIICVIIVLVKILKSTQKSDNISDAQYDFDIVDR